MDTRQADYWAQMAQPHLLSPRDTSQELSPELSHSPSSGGSPVLSDFDCSPHLYRSPVSHLGTEHMNFQYQLPMTPSDFGSMEEAAYCNTAPHMSELSFPPITSPIAATSMIANTRSSEHRVPATSGRRRAQNRAAQRAFRERKEKHARDLEQALSELTKKYQCLESNHTELAAAYEKLRKTIELLTRDDDGGGSAAKTGHSKETLRELLQIIHGEVDNRPATTKD